MPDDLTLHGLINFAAWKIGTYQAKLACSSTGPVEAAIRRRERFKRYIVQWKAWQDELYAVLKLREELAVLCEDFENGGDFPLASDAAGSFAASKLRAVLKAK